MDEILTGIRTLLLEHLAAVQPLSQDLAIGGNLIKVPNTSKFRDGDEIFIMSIYSDIKEATQIKKVNDWDELIIDPATQRGWSCSSPESAYVQKAINHTPLKRIHIGDLRIIPDFPTVTLEPDSEDNDWITIRGTTHEHRMSIRTYVQYDNFETTNKGLAKITKQIREILMDHIHPIIGGISYPLLVDLPRGGKVVTISDTSNFDIFRSVFIRDAKPRPSSQENLVRAVLSPTQLELTTGADFDYLVGRQAELFLINRYFYDCRPSSIKYGFMPGQGGSLMKASEVTYYLKEEIVRQGNILT